MLRPPFPGHRRYSITHRAVQRLRELVSTLDESDDEALRDRLDEALVEAENEGKAIHTLDAKLGEPQTLVPLTTFGEMLFAIIKEDTVVTVLPQGHGEEILHRGQAMEKRVAAGSGSRSEHRGEYGSPRSEYSRPEFARSDNGRGEHTQHRDHEDERGEHRRRWRKDNPTPVVIERIVRGAAPGGGVVSRIESVGSMTPEQEVRTATTDAAAGLADSAAKVVSLPDGRDKPEGPLETSLYRALKKGRRRAAIVALREILADEHPEASVIPLWNELVSEGVVQTLTVGDLLEACRERR